MTVTAVAMALTAGAVATAATLAVVVTTDAVAMADAAAMAATVAMAGPAVDGVVACRNSRWPRRGRCCRRCEAARGSMLGGGAGLQLKVDFWVGILKPNR